MQSVGNRGHAFLLEGELNFMAFVIVTIIVIALFSIFSVTWGLSTLIGVVMIGMAFLTILLGRGEGFLPIMWLIAVAIGVLFLALAYAGIELAVVDLSFIPYSTEAHEFFFGSGCSTCP